MNYKDTKQPALTASFRMRFCFEYLSIINPGTDRFKPLKFDANCLDMAVQGNEFFYSRLPVNEIPLSELLTEDHLFFRVPENWHVLVTDVKNSTSAIENGLHETVNLLATGSIIAVLNIALKSKITIPFFFGGDGASLIVPSQILAESLRALSVHKDNTLRSFDLELRVGTVSVKEIYDSGELLSISKLRAARMFTIPIALGNGLAYAERIVKGADYLSPTPDTQFSDLDLTGMQCRWDKIQPPQTNDEVISLLVIAGKSVSQSVAFKKVIDLLDQVYGAPEMRKPISALRLRMNTGMRKLIVEMRTRFGGLQPLHLVRSWVLSGLARYYFQTKKGKRYLSELVDMSDTLVIDGRINTVISGNSAQRASLVSGLDELERNREIEYGLHVSKESVMSCYVRSINEDHIHFVDGSEGGYTKAAMMLKGKLRRPSST